MRIFDKTVQLNEKMQPVMLFTIELPLVLKDDILIEPKDDFTMQLTRAIKNYDLFEAGFTEEEINHRS